MKECKQGYYFCTKEKKCMPIPSGMRIGYGGWLEPKKKNGKNGKNGNGNGNGSHNWNGNANGNGSNGNGGNGNGGGGNGGGGMGESVRLPLHLEVPNNSTEFHLGLMFRESLDYDRGMLFVFEEVGQKSFHMKDTRIPLDIAFIKEDGTVESIKELNPFTLLPVSSDGEVSSALEVNRGWFAENNVEEGDTLQIGNATGGLAFEVVDLIKPEPIVPTQKTVEWEDLSEVRRLPNYNKPGNILQVYLTWRGKILNIQLFFPSAKKPSRKEVLDQLQKVYPGARLQSFQIADYDPEAPILQKSD